MYYQPGNFGLRGNGTRLCLPDHKTSAHTFFKYVSTAYIPLSTSTVLGLILLSRYTLESLKL